MTALNVLTSYLRQKKGLLLPALFANVLDSVTNALLLISIGKGFSLIAHDTSTKSQLFDVWVVHISDFSQWTLVFFALLALKAVSTFLDHWLNHKASEGFVKFVRHAQLNTWSSSTNTAERMHAEAQWNESLHSEHHNLRKLISAGVLEAAADFTYLLLLFALFYSLDPSLVLIIAAFIPVYAISAGLLGQWITVRKRERSNRKEQLLRKEAWLSATARSHAQLNRLAVWKKSWQTSADKHSAADDHWVVSKALSEAIAPVIFFSMLFAVLWRIQSDAALQPQTFSFILLLIYAQGSLRRSMRVPGVWISGMYSLKKTLPLRLNASEELKKTDLRLNGLFWWEAGKSVNIALHQVYMVHMRDAAQRTALVNNWTHGFVQHTDAPVLLLNGLHTDAPTFKRYVGVVSSTIDLLGESVEEALYIGNQTERKERLAALLAQLGETWPTEWNREVTATEWPRIKWQIIRMVVHDRKVLVLDHPYAHLNPHEALQLTALLRALQKERTILVLTEHPLAEQPFSTLPTH